MRTKSAIIVLCLAGVVLCGAVRSVSAQINLGGFKIPKPKRPSTDQTGGNNGRSGTDRNSGNSGNGDNGQPADVQTNSDAPADYNANLNAGDKGVAVDRFGHRLAVKILAKTGTAYKVSELDDSQSVHWYSLNSVYPYFDSQGFAELMFDHKHLLVPYLACYAKKHNIDEVKVTNMGFTAPNFSNAQEARDALQKEQPNLAELDNTIKSKFGGTPDIFLDYAVNPAIAAEIAAQRGEYLKCAVGTVESKPDFRLGIFLDDIKKAQEEVDRFTPGDFYYLVSAGASSEELERAVSKRVREEWAGTWLKNPDSRAEFDAAWDHLAASAAKKIPQYKPDAADFKFHYPAGEKLLMDSFKNRAALKIFRTGTDTAGWDIQKDESNFPSYRYKDVRVYFRDPGSDDPYCRVVSARVKQDYAGGGTYNPAVYRSSVSTEIFGCP